MIYNYIITGIYVFQDQCTKNPYSKKTAEKPYFRKHTDKKEARSDRAFNILSEEMLNKNKSVSARYGSNSDSEILILGFDYIFVMSR